jgi:GH35 family endo-1,4-beta-xylanase
MIIKNKMKCFKMTLVLIAVSLTTLQAQVTYEGENWKAEANARIEQHRKSDVVIRVTRNGKPVKNAKVEIALQEHEFLFGCGLFKWTGNGTEEQNSTYRKLYADLFNEATLEFGWRKYEPEKDKPHYAETEQLAAWCTENGIRVKGHSLLYNSNGSHPDWTENMTDDELYQRVLERQSECTRHFRNIITDWVVINETVYWADSFRGNRLSDLGIKLGVPELAKACFKAAREGNPQARLILNDNNWNQRLEGMLNLLKDESGTPLYDVIGIQSHFHMASGRWNNQRLWEVCERFAKFDKPLFFTEITILSTTDSCGHCDNIQTTIPGEEWQKEEAVRVYTMLFSHPAVEQISWWDFSDQKAWLGAPAGLLRKDMTPKPAYEALKKLIKEDWATHTTLTTDKKGEIHLRAFRGKYNFTVTLPNGIKLEPSSDVVKKGISMIELKAVK